MLALEIFTGKPPFEEQGRTKATNRMRKGERPQFPQNAETIGLTIQIQELLKRCWCQDPEERLTIDEVVGTLEGFLRGDELIPGTPNGEPALGGDYPLVEPQPPLDVHSPLVDPQPTLDEHGPPAEPQPTLDEHHPLAEPQQPLDEHYPPVEQPALDEHHPPAELQPTLDEHYPIVETQQTRLGKYPSSSTDIANLPT